MVTLTEGDVLTRTEAATLDDVRSLNLWGLNLTDVSLLARLPNLEVLSLSVNSQLQELYARKNGIASLGELHHLAKCRHLRSLWLVDNPCAAQLDKEEYRLRVLRALPQLETLDNSEVTTHERLVISGGDGEFEAYLQTRKKPASSILDTPAAVQLPQSAGAPAGRAAGDGSGVPTYTSPRVNALYAVLALLPTLGREELSAVEQDVHARLGALQAA